MIRSLWVLVFALVATLTFATLAIVAGLLGVRDREGGVYDFCQRTWSRLIIWASGVRVVLHGTEHIRDGRIILVGNHVSWFDVLSVAAAVPRCRFVSKQEVRRIPFVGSAAEAAGHVYIERDNRKAAFEQFKVAAARIQAGVRIVIFAEGTRGRDYPLRPFKKGPFVLAVSAQAPIVPMAIHGTIPMMPKGSFRVQGGVCNIHFLPPIATDGMTYDDRDRLAAATYAAIARELRERYGVESPAWAPRPADGSGGATAPSSS